MSVDKFDSDAFTPSKPFSPSPAKDLAPVTNGWTHADYEIKKDVKTDSRGEPYQIEANEKLSRYLHVEQHPNGGATIVHMYQEEFKHLDKREMASLAKEFFNEVFREEPKGVACHVMGIVHNAIPYIPELVGYLSIQRPDLVVKVGNLSNLRKNEIETVKMGEYGERVEESYSHGTFRCGPLLQLSVVGQVAEESGGYFPQLLGE